VAAFGTYFCMYAFRKPFTAATYDEVASVAGVGYKTVLVVAQVFGYMVSKFVGIRYVAEVEPGRRVRSLLIQVGLAEVALLLFAVTPPPFNAVWLFANGLMLGMIFGLVVGFLEGRRNTEALIAALCTSFILADGVVKSVGSWLLTQGVPDLWMPFAAGLLFVPPLVVCCGILNRVPPPDAADVAARAERAPMTAADRRRFLRRYGVGLGLIVLMYLFVTVLRSVRADFAPEIWAGLGVTPDPALFTRSEVLVAVGILALNGSIIFVRDNRVAFFVALGLAGAGLLLTAAAAWAVGAGRVSPFAFMVLLGLGLYLPYIAVHTTVFERLIAMTRDRGTIGYLMYLADAFGYLGYVAVLLARNLFGPQSAEGILPFFLTLCTVAAVAGGLGMIPAALFFRRLRGSP
jgi:MFS family permease